MNFVRRGPKNRGDVGAEIETPNTSLSTIPVEFTDTPASSGVKDKIHYTSFPVASPFNKLASGNFPSMGSHRETCLMDS